MRPNFAVRQLHLLSHSRY